MCSIEQLKVFMGEKFGVAVESDAVGEEVVLLYNCHTKLLSHENLQLFNTTHGFYLSYNIFLAYLLAILIPY